MFNFEMMFSSKQSFVQSELDLKSAKATDNICFEGPKRLGYFSLYCNDENESVYCPDKSSLRYLDLRLPITASINCLQGYDLKTKYGYKQSKNANLLRWIVENETIVRNFEHDFICNNGVLKDIMIYHNSCYDNDWKLSAIKIRGKIVLNKLSTNEQRKRIATQSEISNKSTYAALNLQCLITKNIEDFQCASRRDDSFFGVFHSKIGSHNILHSGYLDCVAGKQELDKPFEEIKFVSIKKFNAPKLPHSQYHADTWWSLAALSGVDTLIRAKCERNFTVKQIDELVVDNLISKHRQMSFVSSLNLILDHFKSIVVEENKCYNFHFSGQYKKFTGYVKMDLNDNLIPSWYIDGQPLNKPQ